MDWNQFYEKEAEIKRFTPEREEYAVHRTNLVMLLLPKDGMTDVLDVGCGDGYLCHLLKEKGFGEVVGVDVAQKRVQYARQK